MPHSGGGGSHSGGSSSSSSSSFGGSGGSGSSRVKSNNYFAGSRTFVTYKNGNIKYQYANYSLIPKAPGKTEYVFCMVFIVTLLLAIIFGVFSRSPKVPIKSDYDTSIVIQDNIGIIQNRKAVEKACESFRDKTGITPAIITIYNDEWKSNYYNMTNAAFDLYINTFEDEKHYLLVYSRQREGNDSAEFDDWHFETMVGDDTSPVLNSTWEDKMTEKFQLNFLKTKTSFDEDVIDVFDEFPDLIMAEKASNEVMVVLATFSEWFAIIMLFPTIGTIMSAVAYNKYKKHPNVYEIGGYASDKTREYTCSYCGGLYVAGTVLNCPHCGASLPPHNE